MINYNIKFIESLPLSDKTVARRTLQLRTSIESQISEKCINCENFFTLLRRKHSYQRLYFLFLFIL